MQKDRKMMTAAAVLSLTVLLAGCQSLYYGAWEKLGKEKRHLLRDRVEDVREGQEEASEQFKNVLSRIRDLYGFEGGDLEDFYDRLQADYEESLERSRRVSERIDQVEDVARDLFAEWEQEIEEIEKSSFRQRSRKSLEETRRRYKVLHESMIEAENSMEPVLQRLQDYVLYLKHNLNAQAIGSIREEKEEIELGIESLIEDINKSVREAEDFLKTL